jgi:hypothetical protein
MSPKTHKSAAQPHMSRSDYVATGNLPPNARAHVKLCKQTAGHCLNKGYGFVTALTCAGGMGCLSTRSKSASRQAHVGALVAQMFMLGLMDEGSSRLPSRTTVN